MPCNAVATVRARMTLPLEQFVAFPGALDALVVALGDRRSSAITNARSRAALLFEVDGFPVEITETGRVVCRAYSLAESVRAAFEQAQSAVLVELARQQIAATTRVTNEQQIGEQLVMTVEL